MTAAPAACLGCLLLALSAYGFAGALALADRCAGGQKRCTGHSATSTAGSDVVRRSVFLGGLHDDSPRRSSSSRPSSVSPSPLWPSSRALRAWNACPGLSRYVTGAYIALRHSLRPQTSTQSPGRGRRTNRLQLAGPSRNDVVRRVRSCRLWYALQRRTPPASLSSCTRADGRRSASPLRWSAKRADMASYSRCHRRSCRAMSERNVQ